MPRIGALILAAGGSSRMGSPKQLLPLNNRPLIRHSIDAPIAANCSPVRIVLGSSAEPVMQGLKSYTVEVFVNKDWSKGMGTSIRAGINNLPDTIDAILILLADQPLITSAHLRALIDAHEQLKKPLC